jgi:hypothetical protein
MHKVSSRAAKQGGDISQPTLTERNESLLESANGSMATAATRREKKPCLSKRTQNPLTPTGLLMEGDCTRARFLFAFLHVNAL